MPENIQNERELRKARMKKIRRIFEEDITDENIRQYIFGKSGYNDDTISNTNDYVQYIKNILSLAFYFSYACYRCDMDGNVCDADKLSKHNSKRIINSLKNAFVRYPVTQELIQFVLTDIQFELAQGDNSELKGVFGNLCHYDMSKFSFNPYFKLISDYSKNPSRFQFSRLELMKMFIELLEKMSFLGDYQLECYDTDMFSFVLKPYADGDEKYSEMPLTHIFFRDDTRYFGGIYHLFSVDQEEKSAGDASGATVCLRYFASNGDSSVTFTVSKDDTDDDSFHLSGQRPGEIFTEITGQPMNAGEESHNRRKNANSIDQVHTVNYKYIKNLALAISDAISSNDGSKKLIYDRFHSVYPYIFERNNPSPKAETSGRVSKMPYDDESLDWDTIVIMLLIEASPTAVLEYVIRKIPETFFHIVRNLFKRVYDIENLAIFNAPHVVLKEEVNKIINEKLIVGEAGGFGKIPTPKTYDKLFPRAAAMLIISKLTVLQESEKEENLIYTGNLRNNISLLQKINEEPENEKKIKYACIILGETIKHIICFYAGLYEYGKAKAVYDIETYDKCFSKSEIARRQNSLERAFLTAARREAEKLAEYVTIDPASTFKLIDRFVEFCEECNPSNNMLTDNSKHLYVAVGKYEIINTRILKKQFDKLATGSEDAYNYDADTWVATTLEILEYFKTGSFGNTPMDSDLFNTIYPFTAVFNRGKENSDGYKTVNFSLNIDIDDDNSVDYHMDINVLSEFVYNRSEVYYCLPNVIRSNYKWWIDPIMINFREFNDIFSDARKEDE